MRGGTVIGRLALGAALTGCGAAAVLASVRLDAERPARDAASELVYLPDADHLRPLGLGWDNVLADVLWFRTISYFGAHYQTDREYPWLARMCDLVTDLDPRAEDVYRFAGLVLPWEGGQVGEGIRLLEKGVRALPEAWQLRYHLGMVRYFFQDDVVGAAEDLRVASTLPGAPPALAGIAASLAARGHDPAARVAFLQDLLRRTESAEARAAVEARLLEARYVLDQTRLEALVRAYAARTGGLPASLEALVAAGMLRGVPPDPFGGTWVLDGERGSVRSSTGRTPRPLQDSPKVRARRADAAPTAE
jgi:hypothetical protein